MLIKSIVFSLLFTTSPFTPEKTCLHIELGPEVYNDKNTFAVYGMESNSFHNDDLINSSEEQPSNEELTKVLQYVHALLDKYIAIEPTSAAPMEVDWKVLMDIDYKLEYIKEMGAEMYTPVFTKAVEAFHEKEVIIEGYIIPFDTSGDLLALSFYPYASCFFCGKASPASIMSLYVKNKDKRYKVDEFKKFTGKLYLNQGDPKEFYYILRDAKEK